MSAVKKVHLCPTVPSHFAKQKTRDHLSDRDEAVKGRDVDTHVRPDGDLCRSRPIRKRVTYKTTAADPPPAALSSRNTSHKIERGGQRIEREMGDTSPPPLPHGPTSCPARYCAATAHRKEVVNSEGRKGEREGKIYCGQIDPSIDRLTGPSRSPLHS